MRRHFFEVLSAVLILGSFAFFARSITYIGEHEYLGAALILGAGVSLLNVGAELARLALVQRE